MSEFTDAVEVAADDLHVLEFINSNNDRLSLSPYLDGSSAQNESIDVSLSQYVPPPIVQYDYTQTVAPVLQTPYMENWKGEYGFDVAFEENGQATKSCSWTYSPELQRLYVKDNTVIPFHLRVTEYAPFYRGDTPLYVRAHLKYADHQFMEEPVTRCPNHSSAMHPTNTNFQFPDHVVRTEGIQDTVYSGGKDSIKSVRFQLPLPSSGETYGFARLRFMCPNSCPGGMNRRATDLLLVLENSCGAEVGRFRTSIKICSCPGRDREKDEAKLERRGMVASSRPGSGGVVNPYGNKRKRALPNQVTVTPQPKVVKVEVEMLGEDLAEWIRTLAEKANAQRLKETTSLSGPFTIPPFKNQH